jgi:Fe2+ transport system protein FeoA
MDMNTKTTNLSLCKEKDHVTINGISGSSPFRKRLLEMGIIKGESVRIVKYAPLKDPMEVTLKDFHLTLRVNEAEKIDVSQISKDVVESQS